MVYLIGVNHIIQHLSDNSSSQKVALVKEFELHLKQNGKEVGADLLAEEFSVDALRISRVAFSTVQMVAVQLKIPHRFCDPTLEERKRLGIAKEDHHEREQFWMECIRDFKFRNIIFACGNKHVGSFKSLLEQGGAKVQILSQDWGMNFQEGLV